MGVMMVLLLRAAVFAACLFPGAVLAGGLAEPIVESEVVLAPEVIAAESASSGGYLVPLILLAAAVAIVSASSGGNGAPVIPPAK